MHNPAKRHAASAGDSIRPQEVFQTRESRASAAMPLSQCARPAVRTSSTLLTAGSVNPSSSMSSSAALCLGEGEELSLPLTLALLTWLAAGAGAVAAGMVGLAGLPSMAADRGFGALCMLEAPLGFRRPGSSRRRLKPAGGCSVTVS